MKGTLTQEGQTFEATNRDVLDALAGNSFFWLDLDDGAGDGTVGELLTNHFGFHPLAVQAAERFSSDLASTTTTASPTWSPGAPTPRGPARSRCTASGPTPMW